tara:strand:- start:2866 stop:3060 length:195 start_codon:yes stop_codon:yes gene_type:complete
MDMKKVFSYLLAALVMVFTVIAILSIWDVIQVEKVMWKSVKTLMVLFLSAAIVLFIFQISKKDN